jgi:hypothetical protein
MLGRNQFVLAARLLVLCVACEPLITAEDRVSKTSEPLVFARTSICDVLAHTENYENGKPVELHARYHATWEGSWLSDGECEGVGQIVMPPESPKIENAYAQVLRRVAKQYGLTHVVQDKGWQDFNSAIKRLYTGIDVVPHDPATDPAYDYVTADFSGVIVAKQKFRFENGFGNGWGHLGAGKFLLVLQSVSNVVPHPFVRW